MEKSLFPKWVASIFAIFATKVVEKLNGSKNPLTYLHRTMLTKEFSPTLKWGSLSVNNVVVSADVVAMDSSLPLKRRDSISKADGDIPKLGMKLYLNETTMNELNILTATKAPDSEIIKKLFRDTDKVIGGIWEALERMFLEALSTGVTIISSDDNPGLGIRIDFGHPESNKFGVVKKWSDKESLPLDDIQNVVSAARAKGDTLRYLLMDLNTFNIFKKNDQVKADYAFNMGLVGNENSKFPNVPNLEKANELMRGSYNLEIQIIDRMIQVEKDGKRTVINPWAANIVTFLPDLNVGTLTYGKLAEESFPAKQVDYAKVDDMILVSKYHLNDPIKEFTSSQALAIPVINNVDSIYLLNSEEATAGDSEQTEGDESFNYKEAAYTKASVIAAINQAYGISKAKSNNMDSTLAKYIDEMNEEQVLVFEANITEVA